MTNEPRTCPDCGIFYYEWLQQDWRAMLTPGGEPGEPLIPNIHECPDPLPYEIARSLAATYAASGVPISQVERARIRLGLERGPSDGRNLGGNSCP